MLGLVLEGGAMRAIYTAGVLDVFMEQNIWPKGLIGVSAGAIHGSVYLANQPGRTIRYYKRYCREKRFMSFYSLLTTGSMVGEQFCYHDLPERLDPFDYETFAKSPVAYYAVCTDLETGKAVYQRCTDLHTEMDYMRASASMPYVSRIMERDGKKEKGYYDVIGAPLKGEAVPSIPVEAFRQMGYDRNIVVLTQPAGYRKKPQNPKLARLVYRKYPKFAEALIHRHTSYNNTIDLIAELEKSGEIFVIRPSADLGIKRTEKDPARLEEQYNLGRNDALHSLAALKEWIEQ